MIPLVAMLLLAASGPAAAFHPALIRASIDLLGADHVVAGSDWPIASDRPIRGMLGEAIHDKRFSDDERSAIASGNCLQLLGIPT